MDLRAPRLPFAPMLVFVVLLLGARIAAAQTWSLEPNDPNPFCPPDGPTTIQFTVEQSAPVLIQVWSPDTTTVVRTLIDAVQAIGFHAVIWDGTDDGGVDVPDGSYPYRMTAGTNPDILFEDTKVADVACGPSPTEALGWGRIKGAYR